VLAASPRLSRTIDTVCCAAEMIIFRVSLSPYARVPTNAGGYVLADPLCRRRHRLQSARRNSLSSSVKRLHHCFRPPKDRVLSIKVVH